MKTMTTTTEEEKLDFIYATNDAIGALVEPIIAERMNTYREQFGAFSGTDMRLWDSCRIALTVAYQSSLFLDVGD